MADVLNPTGFPVCGIFANIWVTMSLTLRRDDNFPPLLPGWLTQCAYYSTCDRL